jgi:hypothetical protein
LLTATFETGSKSQAAPTEQLAAEKDSLSRRHAMLEPAQGEQEIDEIDERVWAVLSDARLAPFLRIIEQHNSQLREIPERRLSRKDHFLLGPYLRRILLSVRSAQGFCTVGGIAKR